MVPGPQRLIVVVNALAGIIGCPACGHGNRPERRFCAECGSRLPLRCTACGAANQPGEKFCGTCGARVVGDLGPAAPTRPAAPRHLADRVLTARAALEGERKQVTALFADVHGSLD